MLLRLSGNNPPPPKKNKYANLMRKSTNNLNVIIQRLKKSSLFKDSFWAVGGNGIGNFLLLLSGVLIARMLGKDLYGEYGMVKTTMFYLALFSTFALGDTSTKFIAEYIQRDQSQVWNIIKASVKITFITSMTLCMLLYIFAGDLAKYINAVQLEYSFRFLGIIIVCRALNTVGAGILGGMKEYKLTGVNNVVSGIVMLLLAVILTDRWKLAGALTALLISQILLSILNFIAVYRKSKSFTRGGTCGFERKLFSFSFPFAMNELIFSASSWGINLLLVRYASLGDLGMYTACTQWNSIILFMPGLLGNVILSYLSTSAVDDHVRHDDLIKKMLLINFVCTFVPFLIVVSASQYITAYYGPSFVDMEWILSIIVLGTIFTCLTRVFQSDLMSQGRKWTAFVIRSSYNVVQLIIVYVVLIMTNGDNAALNMAYISLFISFIALFMYVVVFYYNRQHSLLIN